MAQVDLYGAGAGRVRSAYRDFLGRDAADDEVTNWLSGAYGHGSQDNLDPIISAIQNSDEARRRQQPRVIERNPNTSGPLQPVRHPASVSESDVPTNPNSGMPDYSQWYPQLSAWYQEYLGREASGREMENWLSGVYGHGDYRNLPGIRTAIAGSHEAQQRKIPPPGGTTTGTGGALPWGDPKGNYAPWFLNAVVAGLTPSGKNLESLGARLQQYGIKLGPRNAGGMIDTIILPDGSRWDVIEGATLDGGVRWQFIPAGSGGASGGGGYGGVGGGTLPPNQYSDPNTALLESLIKSRLGFLQNPVDDPLRQQYLQAMQQRATSLQAMEPAYKQLLDNLQRRFTDLQGPGYTGAENEVIRTGALDPIENDRSAAKKRVIERFAAMGHTKESGPLQQALLEVDKAFDSMRSETQTVLTTNDLNRRESRQQRAEMLGAQLVDIPQARAREHLDVVSAIEMLERAMRGDEDMRSREAIGLGGALSDLGPQRLQLAMMAAGMGGNPSSMFQNLLGLANMNQNAAMMNMGNQRNLWSGIGSIAYSLFNAGR